MRGSSPPPPSAPSRPSGPTSSTCCAAPAPRSPCAPPARRRDERAPRSRFLLGFLLAALVIAGGLSYLASPDPDGLDSVALHGCTVSETAGGEQLDGTCIAQNATESHTARQPARRLRRRRPRGHHRARRDRRRARDGARRGAAVPAAEPQRTAPPHRLVARGALTGRGRRSRPPAVPAGPLGGAPAAGRGQDRRGGARRDLRGGDAAGGVRGVRRAPGGAGRRLGRRRDPARLDPAPRRDRAAVRRARGAAALHRARPADRRAGARPLRARPARRLEHRGQGHAGRADLADPGRDHPAARPAVGDAAAARPGPGRDDRHADAALRRPDRRRGRPDAPRPPVPRARPAVPVAGRGDRAGRGGAVHPRLRARRAGAPGDALPRVRRRPAAGRRGRAEPPSVGGGPGAGGAWPCCSRPRAGAIA